MRRIMLLDTDAQLLLINKKVLVTSSLADEVYCTSHPKEAVQYIKASISEACAVPDVIIFDLYLGRISGFEFMEQLKRLGVPESYASELVIFTSSGSARDEQNARKIGVRHYLHKPYLLRGLRDIFMQVKGAHMQR